MSDRSNGLDEIDVTILSSLSKNGRYSIKYLSDITGISKPAVKKRIDNLIEDGIIEGFTTRLNIKKFGYNLIFYSMVRVSDANHSVEVAEKLRDIKEIFLVDLITGDYDLIFRAFAADQDHLFEILSKAQSIPHVEHLFTIMVIKSLGGKSFEEWDSEEFNVKNRFS